MNIAVITGASSGMGREFVTQLDAQQNFDEIWVIARRKERLEELRGQTRAAVRPIALDLTRQESIDAYAQLLAQEKPSVRVLVNASGFGRFGAFADGTVEEYGRMIDLNSKAVVSMTYVTLPYLEAGSCVYELDSLSSFQPVPYINVYAATKAFVLSFSRALNVELKPRGIRVMAVCPGWVHTEFFDHAVTDDSVTYFNKIYEPQDIIRTALKDMKKGKDVSVHGFRIKAQVLATKLSPHRFVMWVWMRQQRKNKKA
ncbi:MAG: SDR family NAD(P)-dependent oxidoreductase [Eubacteriales bacterium]|nr:SDR family NAD(P)-dependent oxidoreductase [Eubacteriales bacterium]